MSTVAIAPVEAHLQRIYRRALAVLNDSGVPYLVGGGYALFQFAGIVRQTKDLDLFVLPADLQRALDVLADAGFETEFTHRHWLGKARLGHETVDVIFSSGNGVACVDDEWLRHAVDGELSGIPVRLCPPEETIWSKAWVMERERFDGADVAHLVHARAHEMDWRRLLRRFGPHWRVLLGHLVMFGFVYPSERDRVPRWVMDELTARLQQETASRPPTERVCQGTLFSREQYLVDVEDWGYQDARLIPRGNMSREEIAAWTSAIAQDGTTRNREG